MNAIRRNEQGMNILLIPFILSFIFFLASIGFGLWAYNSRQDYKNNVDAKIATAVDVATKQTASQKDNEFIQREKQPLKSYQGPSDYGSLQIHYPKTWSAYVDTTNSATPVNGFFQPDVVPGINSNQNYALRSEVINQKFDVYLQTFDGQVRSGKATVVPYKPVNVPNVVGVEISGQITPQKQGVAVILPLRDKTIVLSTEADEFKSDFNNNILPNFSFTP